MVSAKSGGLKVLLSESTPGFLRKSERQSETEGERETSRRRKIVCIYHCGVLDRVAGCPKLSDPPWSLQGGSESFGTRAQAASGHG